MRVGARIQQRAHGFQLPIRRRVVEGSVAVGVGGAEEEAAGGGEREQRGEEGGAARPRGVHELFRDGGVSLAFLFVGTSCGT